MAKPADYWQARDLAAVPYRGLINEDVMQEIWNISQIPLPLTDAIGSDTCDNPYTEWTTDKLADPTMGGWQVDGADIDQQDAGGGARLGNHCGILVKEVQVSQRAKSVDTIGRADEESYQVMMRQRELRRNVEANALGNQQSQADDGATIPGIPAGLGAMITKSSPGTGTGGVFAAGLWSAWTPGASRGLTEKMVRDACQDAWTSGADPQLLMSVPGIIRSLSEYMFTSSARIASLTRETKGEDTAATALGAVNVFITDFGVTLEFVPNRLQKTYTSNTPVKQVGQVFILDPAYARLSFLRGYMTEELAKTGLSVKQLMSVDFTVKVLNQDAHRAIPDIDPTIAVVA